MPRTINMKDHRRWGDNIELFTPFAPRRVGLLRRRKELWGRLVGWMPKTNRPVAGDTILMPTVDNKTAVLLVEKVDHVDTVSDMFYAEVKFIRFMDE